MKSKHDAAVWPAMWKSAITASVEIA